MIGIWLFCLDQRILLSVKICIKKYILCTYTFLRAKATWVPLNLWFFWEGRSSINFLSSSMFFECKLFLSYELFGIFWNVLECFRIFWSSLGIFWSTKDSSSWNPFGILWSAQYLSSYNPLESLGRLRTLAVGILWNLLSSSEILS